MTNTNEKLYQTEIAARIGQIMKYSGLEISGFAEFTQISESHLYAILNGTRKLTGDIANQIGEKFDLDGWIILQLEYQIPTNLRKQPKVLKFYAENKHVPEFFIDTLNIRKTSHFIEVMLIDKNFFSEPKYVWQVVEACHAANKNYSSKIVSQTLVYLVKKGKLKNLKKNLLRSDGTYTSKRTVNVFQSDN